MYRSIDPSFASMRLLTHNRLSCSIKGVTKGFPLNIEVHKLETKEADFNPDFLRTSFRSSSGRLFMMPQSAPEQVDLVKLEDTDFLRMFHHALLEAVDFQSRREYRTCY